MYPELESERLRLRQLGQADFDAFAAFYADAELACYIGGACGRDEAWRRMATELGHWTLRGYGMWALETKSGGTFVGCCGLWNPEGWPELEVGWWLVRSAQGHGYATEAARRARAYAYEDFGATTLISCIDPDNLASKRVAERLGARSEKIIDLMGGRACIYRHPGPDAVDTPA